MKIIVVAALLALAGSARAAFPLLKQINLENASNLSRLVADPVRPRIYAVALNAYDTVVAIDSRTFEVLGRVPVGHSGSTAAISPDGSKMYVVGTRDNAFGLYTIDLGSLTTERFLPNVYGSDLVAGPNNAVYVARGSGATIQQIDASTGAVLQQFGGSDVLAMGPDLKSLFGASFYSSSTPVAQRYSLENNPPSLVQQRAGFPQYANQLSLSHDGSILSLIGVGLSPSFVISAANFDVVLGNLGTSPSFLAFSPDDRVAYVLERPNSKGQYLLSIYDAHTFAKLSSVTLDGVPGEMVADSLGQSLFIVTSLGARTVIDVYGVGPQITNNSVVFGRNGEAFDLQLQATNGPTKFSAEGLPPGLLLDQQTGKITGTPQVSGAYHVLVTAFGNNSVASSSLTFSFDPSTAFNVHSDRDDYAGGGLQRPVPKIGGVDTHNGSADGTFFVPPSTTPRIVDVDYTSADRTSNISFFDFHAPANEVLLSGAHYQYNTFTDPIGRAGMKAVIDGHSSNNVAGTFDVKEVQFDDAGKLLVFQATFVQHGDNLFPALRGEFNYNAGSVMTNAVHAAAHQGVPFQFQLSSNLSPCTFTASGLPQGLSLDAQTGIISGTPSTYGTFQAAVEAIGIGSSIPATGNLTLDVYPAIRPLNLSTRGHVKSGDEALIGGFIISGPERKTVVLRGLGPSIPGTPALLTNPALEIHDVRGALIASNDDWQADGGAGVNYPLQPHSPKEAAISLTLDPGAYTTVMRGVDGGGIGLVEIYDVEGTGPPFLGNISTRGYVGTGDDVMIGGFILGGDSSRVQSLAIRALGPSLQNAGLSGVLSDPMVELHDANGAVLATNDNWQDGQAAEIRAAGLAPPDAHEAVVIVTIPPTSLTAIVRGVNGTTGLGLVEVYQLP